MITHHHPNKNIIIVVHLHRNNIILIIHRHQNVMMKASLVVKSIPLELSEF
jgi:hypothetical protein